MEQDSLHEDVLPQLEVLQIDPNLPLIISDADEVIFAFVRGLEDYLQDNGYYMDLKSFAMRGNIRNSDTGEAVSAQAVKNLINGFFLERTAEIEPVEGAADALKALSKRAQIIILSNTPLNCREARQRALIKNGMDYPLVANIGKKGAAVAYLSNQLNAPIFFLDDIPHNITSVAKSASAVTRLHFIADYRLRKFLGQAEDADVRIDDWSSARRYIEERIKAEGY